MRLLVSHSPHDRCGIREYGRQLDESLAQHFEVQRFTHLDIRSIVAASQWDTTVLFHYEPSIVPTTFLRDVREIKSRGARVVLCCHWFSRDKFHDADLSLFDLVVVHRAYEGRRHPRIIQIPLGCPMYRPSETREQIRARLRIPEDAVVLVTLGFLTRWKRLPETLSAISKSTRGRNLIVLVQTPWPFSGERNAQSEEDAIKRAVHGDTRVRFSTTFLTERELLDMVHASDLGFLFHGQHTGSVSAATKQFVSARTPLVLTSSTHASDVRAGVVRVAQFDPALFAGEVLRVAQDPTIRTNLRDEMLGEYRRLNMDATARRYADAIRSAECGQ